MSKPSNASSKPSPPRATNPANRSPSRSIPPPANSTIVTRKNTSSKNPTSSSALPNKWSSSGNLGFSNIPPFQSKTASRKTTGTAGSSSLTSSADRQPQKWKREGPFNSLATTSSSPTQKFSPAVFPKKSATPS